MIQKKPAKAAPASLGYSMPAEWAPHRATWLSWPHNRETWPVQLEQARSVWIEMIQALSPHEQIYLLVNDEQTRQDATARLKTSRHRLDHVMPLLVRTVDDWIG